MKFRIHIPEPTKPIPDIRTGEGLLQWLSTVDHKLIGIMYLSTSLFFFVLGFSEAILMRIQLMRPENTFLAPEAYNQIFTTHGTNMIFLVLTPMLLGFAAYSLPLMIGANEMAFPRLNAFSYWIFLLGDSFFIPVFLQEECPMLAGLVMHL